MSEPVPVPSLGGLLAFIDRASRDPDFDIQKFQILLDRHESLVRQQREMLADEEKREFNRAFSRVQQKLEQVVKKGYNQHLQSFYALLEHIDEMAKPIYTAEGFSLRFGSGKSERDGYIRVTAVLSRDGYSEEHSLEGPEDKQHTTSGRVSRSPIQAVGSSTRYLQRYLTAMIFNIVAKNDRTIQPDCERFLAKRMGATTTEAASSHVVMLSQPQVVIDVIRKALKAAQGVTAAA